MISPFLCRGAKIDLFIKQFSSLQSSADVGLQPSPTSTASYLVTSCGLAADVARTLSKKISIKSTERSDAVIELFRDYGFTNSQISSVVAAWPRVLLACPTKNLTPKLEFLTSIGVLPPVREQRLSCYHRFLQRSLERYTIPYYSFLKSLLLSDDFATRLFLRGPSSFKSASLADIACNIAVLRERGVPESWIVSFFMYHPYITKITSEKFAACVNRVVESGFSVTMFKFLDAIRVFASMSDSDLKLKKEIYKKYGWSETDVSAAFMKHPLCLTLSDKKIKENMEFLVNVMGLEAAALARNPEIIGLSREKRLKPRYSVIRILSSKGILKKKLNFSSLFWIPEEKFLKKFVVNHLKDVPRLLDLYQGKLSIGEMETN